MVHSPLKELMGYGRKKVRFKSWIAPLFEITTIPVKDVSPGFSQESVTFSCTHSIWQTVNIWSHQLVCAAALKVDSPSCCFPGVLGEAIHPDVDGRSLPTDHQSCALCWLFLSPCWPMPVLVLKLL